MRFTTVRVRPARRAVAHELGGEDLTDSMGSSTVEVWVGGAPVAFYRYDTAEVLWMNSNIDGMSEVGVEALVEAALPLSSAFLESGMEAQDA